MKIPYKFLSFIILLFVFSCKTKDITPPCKLSVIDRANNNKHTYTYGTDGKINQMIREFDGNGSGKISTYIFTFTYDAAGLLSKSTWILNGKADGSETYSYTNGKVTKVSFVYTDGTKGINNIKYDASGNITEFTYEFGDPNIDGKAYYEYDANNIMIKRGYADLSGNKYFEVIIKPTGVAKSPEQLLNNYGLPYDVLTGFSYAKAVGKEGTIYESFSADNNGKLVSDGKGKTTATKTNASGYIIEHTTTDDTNNSNTEKFILIDCN
jgi:antitoxin component YwqK of YwqJK toxin-antitoxin module